MELEVAAIVAQQGDTSAALGDVVALVLVMFGSEPTRLYVHHFLSQMVSQHCYRAYCSFLLPLYLLVESSRCRQDSRCRELAMAGRQEAFHRSYFSHGVVKQQAMSPKETRPLDCQHHV